VTTDSILERYAPLFAPRTLAVVGASTRGNALPNAFMRRIREFGFTGEIYPIHPTASEIDGLKGGRSVRGHAAALSHTGSLAGDHRAWLALSRQTGCVICIRDGFGVAFSASEAPGRPKLQKHFCRCGEK
jgi:acyl-CoA synthetase (NDP forming)